MVEIHQNGQVGQSPHTYTCQLCGTVYRPMGNKLLLDDMRLHLSMNSHKIKYLVGCVPYLVGKGKLVALVKLKIAEIKFRFDRFN